MKPKKSGFTLIELLVVVAIILVLAGLVFVIARRGTETAYAARCTSNVRQLVTAQLTITGDSGGYLIHSGATPVQGRKRNFAMHFTVMLNDDLAYTSPGAEIHKRLEDVQMLSCPMARAKHQSEMAELTGAGRWRTYALNNRIGYDPAQYNGGSGNSQGAAHDGAMRPEQVQAPNLLMMVTERSWNGNNYPSSFGPWSVKENPIDELHHGGFHVGFMDGHVERMTYRDFPYQGNELPDGRTVEFKANPKTPNEVHWSLVWRGIAYKRDMPASAPE